jgi:hypothetical protein
MVFERIANQPNESLIFPSFPLADVQCQGRRSE